MSTVGGARSMSVCTMSRTMLTVVNSTMMANTKVQMGSAICQRGSSCAAWYEIVWILCGNSCMNMCEFVWILGFPKAPMCCKGQDDAPATLMPLALNAALITEQQPHQAPPPGAPQILPLSCTHPSTHATRPATLPSHLEPPGSAILPPQPTPPDQQSCPLSPRATRSAVLPAPRPSSAPGRPARAAWRSAG